MTETTAEWFKHDNKPTKRDIEDLESTIVDLRSELRQADRLRKNLIYNKIKNREYIIRYVRAEIERTSTRKGKSPETQTKEISILRDGNEHNNSIGDNPAYAP